MMRRFFTDDPTVLQRCDCYLQVYQIVNENVIRDLLNGNVRRDTVRETIYYHLVYDNT
jgi:hypothetical protein